VTSSLTLENFWPVIFFIKNSRNITIRNCRMKHATFAIFAKGGSDENHDDGSAGYLIEGNSWQQDDTPDHKLWTKYDWAEAHGGEGSSGLLRYFNGGFFGAKAIAGDVVIRGNTISDAYNGVRMKAGDQPTSRGKLPRLNANDISIVIGLSGSGIIRSNPRSTPRIGTSVILNLSTAIHGSRSMVSVGATGTSTVTTGRFTARQGHSGDQRHTMGRVLKLSYDLLNDPGSYSNTAPSRPWYVFNNSGICGVR
jgi:hypothetical protein